MPSRTGQIPVIRNGRAVSAYPHPPIISSEELWPSSLQFEVYRLPPMSTEPATGCAAGLIVNLGGPIPVEWGYQRPNRAVMFPHGGICLGSRGELIPAFRWPRALTQAVVHMAEDLFPGDGAHAVTAPMGSTDERILLLVRLMQRELEQGNPRGFLYGESLGHDLAVHLHERYAGPRAGEIHGGLGARRRRMILEFLESHSQHHAGLSAMAAAVGLSVFHFSRAFRREFGMTPYRFVMEERIDRAKWMLAQSLSDHSRIAEELGFSSASHFAAVFRRYAGSTPNAYRKAHRAVFLAGKQRHYQNLAANTGG